jgi:hypothetical protein
MKTNDEREEGDFEVKVYTRKEMRYFYNVPERTFRRWLAPFSKEWGLSNKRYLTPLQVTLIINQFGVPGMIRSF